MPSAECLAWWQGQEQNFVCELETLCVQYHTRTDLADPLFPVKRTSSLFKPNLLKPGFLVRVLLFFFIIFPLKGFECADATLPSDVQEFKRTDPCVSLGAGFFVLAAFLIFFLCFQQRIDMMPYNEKCIAALKCLRQSQGFLCLNTSR